MSAPTTRRPSPSDVPPRRRRSGCALGHWDDECDCIRPWEAEPEIAGCNDCWGDGRYNCTCKGWGEVYARSGNPIRDWVAGSGATGPSTYRDPWDDAVVAWTDDELATEPPSKDAMTTTDDRPVTTTLVLDQRDAAYLLAVLQVAKEFATANYKDGQGIGAKQYFTPGDRFTIKDPASGAKVGTLSMTDPTPKATITDRDAFAAYMAEEKPESVDTVESIDPDRLDEAYDVLRKHAPGLLMSTTVVREQYEKAELEHAAATDTPLPGVEVRTPTGTVTVRLSREGKELIRAQIAAGQVDALRELPPKEQP